MKTNEMDVWDHRPHVTRMRDIIHCDNIIYLCTYGNAFDHRSKLVRCLTDSDDATAWANTYGAVRIDMVGDSNE